MAGNLLDVDDVVFVRFDEVKQKSNSGPGLFIKFFLYDDKNNEFLAATGEDSGDAHYHYKSSKIFQKFGALSTHTRKDVLMWLERVVHESSQRASGALLQSVAAAGQPTADNPSGLYFVDTRQERTQMGDGRRVNKWYLVDQNGKEHLAVVGEERDTRDGHYTYKAEEPFALQHPLNCGNQSGVFHWLEQMVTHYAPAGVNVALPPLQPARAQRSASGRGANQPSNEATPSAADDPGASPWGAGLPGARPSRPQVLSFGSGPSGAAGSRKSGGGGGSGKQKLGGCAEASHLKRLRRMTDRTEESLKSAQAAYIAKLRAEAAAGAVSHELSIAQLSTFVRGEPSEEEANVIATWADYLKTLWESATKTPVAQAAAEAAARDCTFAPPLSSSGAATAAAAATATAAAGAAAGPCYSLSWESDPFLHVHGLRVVLEGLREFAGLSLPVKALLGHQVIEVVDKYAHTAHAGVRHLARHMLSTWRHALVRTVALLMDRSVLEDPSAALEERISLGQISFPPEIQRLEAAVRIKEQRQQQQAAVAAQQWRLLPPQQPQHAQAAPGSAAAAAGATATVADAAAVQAANGAAGAPNASAAAAPGAASAAWMQAAGHQAAAAGRAPFDHHVLQEHTDHTGSHMFQSVASEFTETTGREGTAPLGGGNGNGGGGGVGNGGAAMEEDGGQSRQLAGPGVKEEQEPGATGPSAASGRAAEQAATVGAGTAPSGQQLQVFQQTFVGPAVAAGAVAPAATAVDAPAADAREGGRDEMDVDAPTSAAAGGASGARTAAGLASAIIFGEMGEDGEGPVAVPRRPRTVSGTTPRGNGAAAGGGSSATPGACNGK